MSHLNDETTISCSKREQMHEVDQFTYKCAVIIIQHCSLTSSETMSVASKCLSRQQMKADNYCTFKIAKTYCC